jgi:hypothetical protein
MNDLARKILYEGEPIPDKVIQVAEEYKLDPKDLDWHVEAIHGWERHDNGYDTQVTFAAECLANGGCE